VAINIFMINFEWYRSFIEVYRVGTVSGAAQILHLTQPAVSQHVAALESALGNRLFERTPRRMVPTEAGLRLYTQVAGAIEKLESIPHKNSADRTPQTIRIGAPQEFFTDRILSQLPQDDRTFYTAIWVNGRVNRATQSRKIRLGNCHAKNYFIRY